VPQVLLRGCTLRNTAWAWGVVLFTGPQSKVMMNSTAAPSTLERRLDRLILGMFCLLAAMCLTDAVGAALWVNQARCSRSSQLPGRRCCG
jgi:magnesium-transporting ATPase (P-type)